MRVVCSTCSKTFLNQKDLDSHISSGDHSFLCIHAYRENGLPFKTVKALLRHLTYSPYHKEQRRDENKAKSSGPKNKSKGEAKEQPNGKPKGKPKSAPKIESKTEPKPNPTPTPNPEPREDPKEEPKALDHKVEPKLESKTEPKEDLRNATVEAKKSPNNSGWTEILPSQYDTARTALKSKIHSISIIKGQGYPVLPIGINHMCRSTPKRNPDETKRFAVALDCEMVQTVHNHSELARLSAVDFLTGEVLVDSLVNPSERVVDWRSSITGITGKSMASASKKGNVILGWKAARDELWKYVDGETILVGHALNNDLKSLRIIHLSVIDSAILTAAVVNAGKRHWGLQALCQELLLHPIRQRPKGAHDSLEDAFAAREIVVRCIMDGESVEEWAKKKRNNAGGKKKRTRSKKPGRGNSTVQPRTGEVSDDSLDGDLYGYNIYGGYCESFDGGSEYPYMTSCGDIIYNDWEWDNPWPPWYDPWSD